MGGKIGRILYTLRESAGQLLFPPVCVFCGNLLNYGSVTRVCPKCAPEIGKGRLQSPLVVPRQPSPLSLVFSAYPYTGIYKSSIHVMKFKGVRSSAAILAKTMPEALDIPQFREAIARCGVFVPVPLHRRRELARGFNQALSLAETLAGLYGKPVSDCAVRVRFTKPLSLISSDKRKGEVRNVFKISDHGAVSGKNVMIIDDIYTTGATTEELANALKDAGAAEVCALTYCRAGEKE